MKGYCLLFLLLALAAPARAARPAVPSPAASQAAPGFDAGLVSQVYTAALGFIVPRTLDPVSVPQLTVWGLRGITALDPDLTAALRSGRLVLARRTQTLYAVAAPTDEAPGSWAAAAVGMTVAAWNASPAVRRAGTQGVIGAFFDEMFNHLDPYSRYVPPVAAAEGEAELDGSAGLGLSLAARGRAIVVTGLVADGPAARAGLRIGDRILSVDGRAATPARLPQVVGAISGPAGTEVLVHWQPRAGPARQAQVERAMVPPQSVFSQRLAHMLILRVIRFNRATEADVAAPIEEAMAGRHPPDGIVIDLRGNPGGLLREAVTTADVLLPAGIVAITAGRDPAASRIWRSTRGEAAPGLPVVVLVDGRTASAAEILAASLADRGRAVVVGSATFGKGLVQTFTNLPGGGELFVTWSRVLAPRGWPLQSLGVLPQICTSLGEHAVEGELQALEDGVAPMAAAIARERESRAPVPAAEAVAIRSACPAAVGREIDLEVAHFLIENPAAYVTALLSPLSGPTAGLPGAQ